MKYGVYGLMNKIKKYDGIKYCPNCGNGKLKFKKRPDYNEQTGKLKGYYLDIWCDKWWHPFRCGGIYWGYEELK